MPLKNLIPAQTRRSLRNGEYILKWYLSGKTGGTPDRIKRGMLKSAGKKNNIKILVETGTFGGDTVEMMRHKFDKVISIELNKEYADRAKKRFADAGAKNVTIVNGDSGKVLADVLKNTSEPVLFWLDGHYSGGDTAKGDFDTPVMGELSAIFAHPIKDHVIHIDDARCFDGTNDYPKMESLREFVSKQAPYLKFDVKNGIIILKKI